MTLYQNKYRAEPARLRGWDYSARGWYFVTICAHNHACIFGEIIENTVRLSRIGIIAEADLKTLPTHYDNVDIDAHVVMPNHVHAIVVIDGDHCFSPGTRMSMPSPHITEFAPPKAGSLSAILRSYKAGVTRKCHDLGMTDLVWQPRFYDHLIRGDKVINAVREYIKNNPKNWQQDQGSPLPILHPPAFVET